MIVPIGGAEKKRKNRAVLKRFVKVCGGRDARILVVLRNRGGEEEPAAPEPVDTWIRTPSLV